MPYKAQNHRSSPPMDPYFQQPFYQPQLHHPVPLQGQSALLDVSALGDLHYSYPIPTFPTPSELMADMDPHHPLPPQFMTEEEPRQLDLVDTTTGESARKARRRAVARSVGFVPTDPDTISSHEKKRHYLECIEQYILYLHEQFQLIGEQPPEIERVATYRGLSSRSIRTLLVHMEHSTRKLNDRTVDEEQKFLSLRNEIYFKQGFLPQ